MTFYYNSVEITYGVDNVTVYSPATSSIVSLKLIQVKNIDSLGLFTFAATSEYGIVDVALGDVGETYAQGAGKIFMEEGTSPIVDVDESFYIWLRWKAPLPRYAGNNHIGLDVKLY